MNATLAPPPGRGADLIAGLSIAGLLLPSAVAYADIAGLPAQAGVVALFAGMVCYAIIGRSRFAIVSPTSSSAAVLAAGVIALAEPSGVAPALVAASMVVLTGILFGLAALLRLGGLSQLVARPVLRGFAFGLAIVIAIGQLPHLAGLPADRDELAPRLLWHLLRALGAGNPYALGCGGLALLLLVLGQRLPKLPTGLLVVLLGILASPWLAAHGVARVGAIATLPSMAWPVLPPHAQWLPSIELGAALVLVLYAESYASIRAFALRHGDPVDADRDLLALGLANLASGLLHGAPVGAGYSATAANEAAGARSRRAALIALACSALAVGFGRHGIEAIPQPVLAAIVIHAVSSSWRLAAFAPYFRWRRDRLLVLATIGGVLLLGILEGLLLAIALSLVLLLRQLARPRLSVLGRLDGGHDFVPIARAGAIEPAGVRILRPEEPLFFANAEAIFALARARVAERPNLRAVVLSLEESPDLDGTALEALGDFSAWLQARGVGLKVARLKDEARSVLAHAKLPQLPAAALDAWSVDDAVRTLA